MYKLNILLSVLLLLLGGCGGDTPVPEGDDIVIGSVRLKKIADLNRKLKETSGMIMVDGRLYTHNDSGNQPYLYEINSTNGEIIRNIHVDGAVNRDWEDLAQDDTYVYIADTGNNLGNRRDIKIYKIAKSDLLNLDSVPSESIGITYGDQNNFNYPKYTTPFDAEALIAFDGSLYLFSKNWDDYTTSIYKIPSTVGDYEVYPVFKKRLNIMVTAADFNPEAHSIVLIGYSNPYKSIFFKMMIFMLSDYLEDDFFSGTVNAVEIENNIEAKQIEGVSFFEDGNGSALLISAEGRPAILYRATISTY
jgi:hypothetical protein